MLSPRALDTSDLPQGSAFDAGTLRAEYEADRRCEASCALGAMLRDHDRISSPLQNGGRRSKVHSNRRLTSPSRCYPSPQSPEPSSPRNARTRRKSIRQYRPCQQPIPKVYGTTSLIRTTAQTTRIQCVVNELAKMPSHLTGRKAFVRDGSIRGRIDSVLTERGPQNNQTAVKGPGKS